MEGKKELTPEQIKKNRSINYQCQRRNKLKSRAYTFLPVPKKSKNKK